MRNLSEATIHTYVGAVERYAKHFNTSPVDTLLKILCIIGVYSVASRALAR